MRKQCFGARVKSLGSLLTLCAAFEAWARQIELPLPEPSRYADCEGSTNAVLSGWNDLTRFMNVHAEVFASLASCVQVAFGTDRDVSGDLTVGETDLVLGYATSKGDVPGKGDSLGKGDATFLSREESEFFTRGRNAASPLPGVGRDSVWGIRS